MKKLAIACMVVALAGCDKVREVVNTQNSQTYAKSWCNIQGGTFEHYPRFVCSIPQQQGKFRTGTTEMRFMFEIDNAEQGTVRAYVYESAFWILPRYDLEAKREFIGIFQHPGGDFEK